MRAYYEDSHCTIYHGDCREIMPQLEPDNIDYVLTDPPYGIHKAEWDQQVPWWWIELLTTTKALAFTPGIWNLLSCPRQIGEMEYRWCLCAHLVNGMTRGAIGFGNWIPCLMYSDNETSLYKQDGDARDFVVGRTAKPEHESPKPLAVFSWFLSRIPGNLILDPFMGSGTTLLAAKEMNRKAIGIELEERYCEIAAKRLAQGVLL